MPFSDTDKFARLFGESLSAGTFVKATVGNYKGANGQLQKVTARLVSTKKGELVQFVTKFKTREEAKNLPPADAPAILAGLFEEGFRSGHLFTTKSDYQLAISKKGRAKLTRSAPTMSELPDTAHDRKPNTPLDASRKYLHLLGITTPDGKVRDKKQAKFRQIGRFVSILDGLIEEAGLKGTGQIDVADMGSGKGYLTFALYDHLCNALGLAASVKGIEERGDLVDLCSRAASHCGFEGLRFDLGTIADYDAGSPDILIALHACDTATDDAIFKGIIAGSKIIVAAPCCQKELRPQLKYPGGASPLNEFGLLLERETESVTDGIRALLLGHLGYKVRMMEFVSPEHTPKNNLIAAVLEQPPREGPPLEAESVMRHFGIASQKLHSLLRHVLSER
ncbi:MAG: SAM-dependent methyltransferase [Acidobacteriota bacterium]|nr:MAG: SAM-dependent methyltransferase [Acidobacteriota bacterium]